VSRRHVAGFLTLTGAVCFCQAVPPKLEHVFPAGAARGSTVTIALGGKGLQKVWLDAPETFISPGEDENQWRLSISDEAQPGLHLIRAYNADGVSNTRWFSIGLLPDSLETEPNDGRDTPQRISPPVCVNGRLSEGGDVDGFAIPLKAGTTLVAAVEAYCLGSPLDALLNVLDPDGVRVATSHDGRSLDPVLIYTAAKSGVHVIQLSGFAHPPTASVSFTGGESVVYRLHVSDTTTTTHVTPPVITRGTINKLEAQGCHLPAKEKSFSFDATKLATTAKVAAITPPVGGFLPLPVWLTEKSIMAEKEPNNETPQANAVQESQIAWGTISAAGDVDRFSIAAKKGQRLEIAVRSKILGFPLDANLRIESADGKLLATSDDSGDSPDPYLTVAAPSDGALELIVADLFSKGGPAHHYVVEVNEEKPDFSATVEGTSSALIEPGKTTELKAKVKLTGGFKSPLVVRMQNLPPGIAVPEVGVPEKGGEVTIKLMASADAPPANQPMQLSIWTKDGSPLKYRNATTALRGEEKRGNTSLDETDQLWITVLPAKN
jgi:hypothetical protein